MTPDEENQINNAVNHLSELYSQSKYHEILSTAENLLKKYPKQYAFLDFVRNVYYCLEKSQDIRKTLERKLAIIEKILAKTPKTDFYYRKYLYDKRCTCEELRFYEKAIETTNLQKEISRDDKELEQLFSKEAYYLEKSGNFEQADAIYKNLVKKNPLEYAERYIYFLIASKAKKEALDEARKIHIKSLQKLLAEFPSNDFQLDKLIYHTGELTRSNPENRIYLKQYIEIFEQYLQDKPYSDIHNNVFNNLIHAMGKAALALKLMDQLKTKSMRCFFNKYEALQKLKKNTQEVEAAIAEAITVCIKEDRYEELQDLSIYYIDATAPQQVKEFLIYCLKKSPSTILSNEIINLKKEKIPYKESTLALRRLMQEQPEIARNIHLRRADLYSKFNKYTLATNEYEKAQAIREDSFIYHTIAEMYEAAGNKVKQRQYFQKYVRRLEQIVANSPDDSYNKIDLAEAYEKQEKYSAAIEQLKAAIEINPEKFYYYNRLARLYSEKLFNYEVAIAVYNDFLKYAATLDEKAQIIANISDMEIATVNYKIGRLYEEIGRQDDAIAQYDKAMKLRHDEYDFFYKGKVLREQSKYQESIECLKECVKIHPNSYGSWLELGNTYEEIKQYDEAERAYKKSLKFKPDFASAYICLGVVHSKVGNIKKAIEYTLKGLKLEPEDPNSWNNLRDYYHQLGDHKEARQAGKKAIKYYKKELARGEFRDMYYFGLAEVLADQGKIAEARENLQKSLKINPYRVHMLKDTKELQIFKDEKWLAAIIQKFFQPKARQ